MFLFGSSADTRPEFVPDADARRWLTDGLQSVIAHLGPPARKQLWITEPLRKVGLPRDLDGLFDFLCLAQEHIGQSDLEFTLAELEPGRPPVPPGFEPLGDPAGHLLHSFARGPELAVVVMPAAFRVPALLLGNVARELGRLGLWTRPDPPASLTELGSEASAELAAISLGLGVWVANGAYMFENACCGGGCGVDLKGVRAGLSLPEASYALALDAKRKGLSRRVAARQLEPTQETAFKKNWDACDEHLAALPPAREAPPALRA